ncbi:hypothetical protein B0H19DRAFT_1369391, partial [Mycena capillaripes]
RDVDLLRLSASLLSLPTQAAKTGTRRPREWRYTGNACDYLFLDHTHRLSLRGGAAYEVVCSSQLHGCRWQQTPENGGRAGGYFGQSQPVYFTHCYVGDFHI